MDVDPRLYEHTTIGDTDVSKIVLSYLVHGCFKETAESFISSSGMKPDADYLSGMDERKSIYQSALEGNPLKAIELTEQMAPNLLAENSDLHFDLLSLHFIELIRSRKCEEAVEFGKKMLSSFGKTQRCVEKLQDMMALFAYEEPEKSPMFHFLSPEYQLNVAEKLNQAILAHANLPSHSLMERLVRQVTVVRQHLQLEHGQLSGIFFEVFSGEIVSRYLLTFIC